MKSNESSTAQRVWQRVSPSVPAPGLSERETMLQLIRQLLCDRGLFLRTASKLPPAEQLLLHRLAQGYAQEAACLKGVLRLTTGGAVKDPADLSPTQTLNHCYRHALTRLTAYSLRTADPLCAPAFRQLEEQTRHHCVTLLQLIGLNDQPSPKKSHNNANAQSRLP